MLGPFRLDSLIGRGGMGEVYRARDTEHEREVALKLLRVDLGANPEFRSRFQHESRMVARLRNPHVVPIHSYGEIDGRLFLNMRLIEGPSLAAVIQQHGRVPVEPAVEIITQVASALEEAHSDGIVHRDVKPSNVLFAAPPGSGPDFVYLTDFGIASSPEDGQTTATGVVVGTLAYMAPERFLGEPLGPGSDVYALACVLYEALTGEPPFTGESLPALLHAHLYLAPPRASSRARDVPPALDEVIIAGLAKRPELRPRSAQVFADMARAALTAPPPAPAAAPLQAAPAPAYSGPPSSAAPSAPAPSAGAPVAFAEEADVLHIDLPRDFHYVHEPISAADPFLPLLGREELIQAICARIRRSTGGAILLGGFRGAGKTTVVNHALEQLKAAPGDRQYVTIQLNLARPIGTNDLLFAIVRRLFEELDDSGLLQRLPSDTRSAIILSYARTSMSLANKRSESRESSRTLGMPSLPGLPGLHGLSPRLERTTKTSRSLAVEASFLAYSDSDVEHDFLRIIRLLHSARTRERGLRRLLRRPRPHQPIHIVVVLDELDKLTASPAGEVCLEEILAVLKNIFTTAGIHVLFVAGVDLLDRSTADYQLGIGLFEGVFAWTAYVCCLWDAPDRLLASTLSRSAPSEATDEVLRYLRYKGRGLPRRLFHDFNNLVRFDAEQPRMAVSRIDRSAFALYANLADILEEYLGQHAGERHSSLEDDRFRLGAHYVVDWILRSDGTSFVVDDLITGDRAVSALLRQSERRVESLLKYLVRKGVLVQLSGPVDKRTVISNIPQTRADRYRLTDDLTRTLARISRLNEHERGALSDQPDDDIGALDRQSPVTMVGRPGAARDVYPLRRLAGGKYELVAEIGSGSVTTVFDARNCITGQRVAARIVNQVGDSDADESLRDRFLRQAQVALGLDHPGIVRAFELCTEEDGVLALITDFADGKRFDAIVEGGAPPAVAVELTRQILDVVGYLHSVGLIRLDVKPTNFIMGHSGRLILTDLTLARPVRRSREPITLTGVSVGTPFYMAPEQLAASTDLDGRADIYAVGVILFELIASQSSSLRLVERPARHLGRSWDVAAIDCSPQLRAVVDRALAPDPAGRFQTAADFAGALASVPEFESTVQADSPTQLIAIEPGDAT